LSTRASRPRKRGSSAIRSVMLRIICVPIISPIAAANTACSPRWATAPSLSLNSVIAGTCPATSAAGTGSRRTCCAEYWRADPRSHSERSERVHLGQQGAPDIRVQGFVPVDDDMLVLGQFEPRCQGDFERTAIAAMAEKSVAAIGILAERILEQVEPESPGSTQRGTLVR